MKKSNELNILAAYLFNFVTATCVVALLYMCSMAVSFAAPGGGNDYFGYVIDGPIPAQGLSEISFYLTIKDQPHRSTDVVYWSNQFSFKNGTGGYTGMQPRPDVNGIPQGRALFSVFGGGATSNDQNCHSGADGGPGVSCSVSFGYVVGKTYQFQVMTTAPNVWQGTVIDTATGNSTHIGTWTLPASSGNLQKSQLAFTEFYGYYPTCEALPSTSALFGPPTAANGALKGRYTSTWIQGKCPAQFHNWVDAAGGHSDTNYTPPTLIQHLVGIGNMCAAASTVTVPPNQSAVTLQACRTGAPEQIWTSSPDGTLQTLGKCLNASQAKDKNGNYIVDLQVCDGNLAKQWTWKSNPISGKQNLINKASRLCLDAAYGSSNAGTALITYACGNQTNQLWNYNEASKITATLN